MINSRKRGITIRDFAKLSSTALVFRVFSTQSTPLAKPLVVFICNWGNILNNDIERDALLDLKVQYFVPVSSGKVDIWVDINKR